MPTVRTIGESRQTIRDFGTCLKFDGVDGVATESLFDTFTTTTKATVSFWAKLDQAPTNSADSQPIIVTKYFYIYSRLVAAGKHAFFIRFDEAQARQTGADVKPTLGWNHFTFIYNPTGGTNVTLTAYVNGNQANSDNYTALPTGAKTVGIGKSGSTYFKGQLDEIKVWNRILSEDEVIDNYLGIDVDTTSLVTYYKANEGSGTSLTDSSTQGNTGTLSGGITYVTDPPMGIQARASAGHTTRQAVRGMGKSLAFSGTNTSLTLPITPATTGFNVGFWLMPKLFSASNIVMSYSTDETTTGFRIYHHTTQRVFVQFWDTSLVANLSSGNGSLPYGVWHHIVLTFGGGTAKIYVDGIERQSDPTTAFAVPTGQTLTFGKRSYANTWGGFLMDELIFHNTTTAWTQAQITDLYRNGSIPSDATGVYLMNDAVTDSSGNGNNGTLTNGAYSTIVPKAIRSSAY